MAVPWNPLVLRLQNWKNPFILGMVFIFSSLTIAMSTEFSIKICSMLLFLLPKDLQLLASIFSDNLVAFAAFFEVIFLVTSWGLGILEGIWVGKVICPWFLAGCSSFWSRSSRTNVTLARLGGIWVGVINLLKLILCLSLSMSSIAFRIDFRFSNSSAIMRSFRNSSLISCEWIYAKLSTIDAKI